VLDPKNDKYHFTLGALYDEAKRKQESIGEMRRAIELNPSNAQALNYLGYSYAEMGTRLDEAEKLIRRAIDIEPEDGAYIDSLGWVYYQKGQYKKAVEELERAVDLIGDDPTIAEHLADAYKKIGRVKEAHQLYQDALSKAKETDQVERLKDKLQVLRDDGRAAQ
jgi:Flp pilus assembly protein TadD